MRIEGGKYIAETAEEMQELMQMALQGGPRSPQLSRNTNISALETLGILGATYPGSTDLLGLGDVNLGNSQGYSTGRNPHYYSNIEGPSSQAAGYGSRATRPLQGGGPKPNVPGPATRLRNTIGTVGGATEAALGLGEVAKARSGAIGKGVKGATKLMGFSPTIAGRNGRIAMQALKHPALQAGLKWAGPVGAALAVGDLVLGQESLANKGMDVAMMTAGGALGSVVPVVGTALGAAGGKMVSDGLQFVFGGGKSPEQRKLEEALAMLQARGLV